MKKRKKKKKNTESVNEICICLVGPCAAAGWQQTSRSEFKEHKEPECRRRRRRRRRRRIANQ